jgi:hypothetical protein
VRKARGGRSPLTPRRLGGQRTAQLCANTRVPTSMRPTHFRVLIVIALTVVSLGSAAELHAAVMPEATLSVAGTPEQALGPVAASDNSAAVVGTHRAYVFSTPGPAWTSETQSAVLVDSSGAVIQPTAISFAGSTAVVNENGGAGSYEDVFTEPATGWAGTIPESAKLIASDGAVLSGATSDGTTVAAVGTLPSTGVTSLYVFTEPLGGWTGILHETAVLTDSHRDALTTGAISGRYIFAPAGDKVDVFKEPDAGWAGHTTENATLTTWTGGIPLSPLAASANVVLAGTYVFTQPTGGWTHGGHPAAQLVPSGDTLSPGFAVAASDHSVALGAYTLGTGHACPCSGSVWVFTKPTRGWSGILNAPASVHTNGLTGPIKLAIDEGHLFISGQPAVSVYTVSGAIGRQAGPPRIATKTVLGLAAGRPLVSFTVRAGSGAPHMRSIAVTLPRGLGLARLNHHHTGVAITDAGPYTLRRRATTLIIDCTQSCTKMTATLRPPALTENAALRRQAIPIPHHRQGRRLRLRFTLQVAYIGDRPIRITVQPRIQ